MRDSVSQRQRLLLQTSLFCLVFGEYRALHSTGAASADSGGTNFATTDGFRKTVFSMATMFLLSVNKNQDRKEAYVNYI